jgi:ABC-type antimicrobial peptide transport system permease subunit
VGTFDTMRMWLRGLSHELAIRRAVGATRRRIAWWVLARAAGAGIVGTALGVFLYLSVMMPAVTELMNGVPVWDGRVALGSAALLVAAMMAGAAVPLVRMLGEPVAGGLG